MRVYYKRIADSILDFKINTFGAVLIVGPKWCGKTTTASKFSNSSLKLESIPNKESIIETARVIPQVLLEGEKPRLIDEWQNTPQIWYVVRSHCDENHGDLQ